MNFEEKKEELIEDIISSIDYLGESFAIYEEEKQEAIKLCMELSELIHDKPKVKDLEWFKAEVNLLAANIEGLEYFDYTILKLMFGGYQLNCTGDELAIFCDIEEAKQSAQDHFNNLILGCLVNEQKTMDD